MVAVLVVALMVMSYVAGFVILKKASDDQAWVQQFQASLAKHLPPDVQADMKPRQLLLGLVIFVAILFVVPAIIVAGSITTGNIRLVGYGLAAVACAWFPASIARTWLKRRYPGEVLADLSPYPIAGAVRRNSWRVATAQILFIIPLIGFQAHGEGYSATLAVWATFVLLFLLLILMYSDRVWLAERGLYFSGRLYPWDGFERVAWTDDGRAFAFRRKGRWRLQRWTVVPVPEGSREAAEEALRQVMPAPIPSL